jgi:hypothetical protein
MKWVWTLLGALSLPAALFGVLWTLEGRTGPALVAHLGGGGVAALAAVRLRLRERGHPWFELVTALAVPFAGGVLAWIHATAALEIRRAGVAEDFRDQISVQKRLGEEALPEIDATPPHPAFLTPMSDVLASDASNDEKRMAIEGLARLETPQAVEILRQVLSSGTTEVRFYAASVLEGLEERLTERLMTLERDVATGRRRGPGTELEIARTFLDYAYYRVAIGPRRQEFLEQAARHGSRAREHGSDPEAHLVEGRALLLLGRAEAAEACFSRYVRTALHRGKALVWRAEARFRLGRYEAAAVDCQQALAEGTVPDAVREAVETWAALAPGGAATTEATEAA